MYLLKTSTMWKIDREVKSESVLSTQSRKRSKEKSKKIEREKMIYKIEIKKTF